MAGLSKEELTEIGKRHMSDVGKWLRSFPWQRVVVLTIADFPGSKSPRASEDRMVTILYPKFLRALQERIGAPIDDFWALEHGDRNGRQHLNVLLSSTSEIPEAVVYDEWRRLCSSDAWQDTYDPGRYIEYWIKELPSSRAAVHLFGGSVVLRQPAASESWRTKPRRTRKRDHVTEERRQRFRAQGARFPNNPREFF